MGAAANSVGATTTFAFMPFPDDPDDDAGFVPPLPQDDRLWRHPSEMMGMHAAPALPARRRSSRSGLIALFLIGTVAATVAIATIGALTSGTSSPSTELAIGPAADVLADEVVASLHPVIVQIKVDGPSQSEIVTGLLIRSDGHVITAADPLRDARALTVTLADGRSFNAVVVGTDAPDDLAVIDIEASGLSTPTFGDTANIDQGDTVFVVGRTREDRRSWIAAATFQATGMRLDTNDGTSLHDMIGSTLDVTPPTSSAVLCTSSGEVIGMLTSRSVATNRAAALSSAPSTLELPQAVNLFAHSMSWTTHVADDLIASGQVHHAWLGVMSTDAPSGGAEVQSVVQNGPAAKAGVREGDIITSLNDRSIATSSELLITLRSLPANEKTSISLLRGDQRLSVNVQLSDRA